MQERKHYRYDSADFKLLADWEKKVQLAFYLCKSVFDLQQQNFKQKVVALLKRFKVSDEVRNLFCKPSCLVCLPLLAASCFRLQGHSPVSSTLFSRLQWMWPFFTPWLCMEVWGPTLKYHQTVCRSNFIKSRFWQSCVCSLVLQTALKLSLTFSKASSLWCISLVRLNPSLFDHIT